jgi:gamma-glutamyltranspeptidase/glutathione hydrolase
MNARRLLFLILCFFAPALGSLLHAQPDRVNGRVFATRSPVLGQHGMVCTSHPLATQAGLDILKAGGSAIDAAIAANATLGLMEPVSNGMGGDLFAIVWDAKIGRASCRERVSIDV